MKKFFRLPGLWFAMAICFYAAGALLLFNMEHPDMPGTLTYWELYCSAVIIFFAALFIGVMIFKNGESCGNKDEFKHANFAFCILGLLLTWSTTKATIPSTALFWLATFSMSHGGKLNNLKK